MVLIDSIVGKEATMRPDELIFLALGKGCTGPIKGIQMGFQHLFLVLDLSKNSV